MNKTEQGIMLLGFCVIMTLAIVIINSWFAPQHFYETAPNGFYQQKEWGYIDPVKHEWWFARCDHDYLGPLHGEWKYTADLSNFTLNKVNEYGVQYFDFPDGAQLFIQIYDNVIVEAWIK